MYRVGHLIRKELLELRQDPRLFGVVVLAPIIQLAVLGYAASTDVKDVPVLVVDADRTAASRELIARFDASDNFTVVGLANSSNEIDEWLESGRAWMALSIPPAYGDAIRRGATAQIQVVADGTDSNSTNVALGYTRVLVAGYAQDLLAERLGRVPEPLVTAAVRVWFNPDLVSRDFMIPGIVALLLLVITTNLSAMAIVKEKELGTLEQLNVTPLARWELITGKLLPYALVGIIDVVLVLIVSIAWFEVPMRGSVIVLFGVSLVYLLSTLGLGLFISTVSATQQQAMMTTTFFFLIPMMYLSGFIFPIENMPGWIQPVTYLLPLRYFLVVLRGIFLKGVGFETFWPEVLALFVWGLAMLTLATLRSSKRLA
jgi:ABC-2 type transport system permease protein